MFKQRFITALIATPIVVISLYIRYFSVFFILIFSICILSLWEWSNLLNLILKKKKSSDNFLSIFLLNFIILFFVFFCLLMSISLMKFIACISILLWILISLIVLFYPYSVILCRKLNFIWFILVILVILCFFFHVIILYNYYLNTRFNLLVYILVLTWIMDSGSYIFGNILGKNKLANNISPNKTWEGFIGGILISNIFILILSDNKFIFNIDNIFLYSSIAIFFSIIGDLFESMIKREAKVKDSSNLIIGHGGILDCIDSTLASVPIFSSMLLLFSNYKLLAIYNY